MPTTWSVMYIMDEPAVSGSRNDRELEPISRSGDSGFNVLTPTVMNSPGQSACTSYVETSVGPGSLDRPHSRKDCASRRPHAWSTCLSAAPQYYLRRARRSALVALATQSEVLQRVQPYLRLLQYAPVTPVRGQSHS